MGVLSTSQWAVFMTRTPLKHNVNKGPYLVLISTLEDPLFPRINMLSNVLLDVLVIYHKRSKNVVAEVYRKR